MNQPPDVAPIVEFLRARLDEDEAVARRACEYAEASWKLDEDGETILWWPPEPRVAEKERELGLPVTSDQWRGQTIASSGQQIAPHIARHDPARVLRQTAILRNRVELWSKMAGSHARACLRELAAIWEDHPDYRPEWRL